MDEIQTTPPRRERKTRPPSVTMERKTFLILLGAALAVGLLLGILIRGAFLPTPEAEEDTAETGHAPVSAQNQTDAPSQTEDPPKAGGSAPAPELPADTEEWQLFLVNPWNPIPEDYAVELSTLPNGLEVDRRCYEDLMEMLSDCRDAGLSPIVCSAYRTVEYQQKLYDDKIRDLMDQGLTREEAEETAGTIVAYPGTSEHHLGLAVDIVDEENQRLDESQEDTPVQQWLMENCWRYGFILRYPNNKSDVTGIIYEPWHYRYVGRELAAMIHELDVCLEEFLELL